MAPTLRSAEPLPSRHALRLPRPSAGVPSRPQHNLPAQPGTLIGRQAEVASLGELLRRADVRLITLTGPPGIGKTRLALEAATAAIEAFADGVYFVDLAPIGEPELVIPTIGHTLGLRESFQTPSLRNLILHLRDRRVLLVLDNFEQVVGASGSVSELLAGTLALKILVTSREILRVRWEHTFMVPPLKRPNDPQLSNLDELVAIPSVALFVERARAVKPSFPLTAGNAPAIAEVCARLEGLPLGIELAAARVRIFEPSGLLDRLRQRLDLPGGGARDLPARQQTLRSAIGWSDSLLNPDERILFRRLAIFVGGWDLAAAESVCGRGEGAGPNPGHPLGPPFPRREGGTTAGDSPKSPPPQGGEGVGGGGRSPSSLDPLEGLASLVDKSLVRQESRGAEGARFSMLEVIREYAREQLEESGELPAIRRRHAQYFLALAEAAEPELEGPSQVAWLDRLEREHDNLRGALHHSLEDGDVETALRLSGALWKFWWVHDHLIEGQRWLDEALGRADGAPLAARAKALSGAGNFARYRGDDQRAVALHEESLAAWRQLGDRVGTARALQNLRMARRSQGQYELARSLLEEGLRLFRESDDQHGVALALNNLGLVARDLGETEPAARLHEASLDIRRALGDKLSVAHSLNDLGIVIADRGDFDRAVALHRESLAIFRELLDALEIGVCLERLAWMASARRQPELAARLFAAAEVARETIGVALPPPYAADRARWLAHTREQLGESGLRAAWKAGRAMSLEEAMDAAAGDRAVPPSDIPIALTAREREVATLIARGYTNRQIADELIISERTAEAHVANIRAKLGFASRTQIAAWVVEAGLISPPEASG